MSWLRFLIRSAIWTFILNWVLRRTRRATGEDYARIDFRHQTRQMGLSISEFLKRRISR